MLPDDVFRDRLERTLVELEAWADTIRDCASVEIAASAHYWRLAATPYMAGACAFELMVKASQAFSLRLDRETYENRPLDNFDLFQPLVGAIAAGRVERIETASAATGALLAIETRIALAEGWDWLGGPRAVSALFDSGVEVERRVHRFLPYRR